MITEALLPSLGVCQPRWMVSPTSCPSAGGSCVPQLPSCVSDTTHLLYMPHSALRNSSTVPVNGTVGDSREGPRSRSFDYSALSGCPLPRLASAGIWCWPCPSASVLFHPHAIVMRPELCLSKMKLLSLLLTAILVSLKSRV